MEAGYEVRQTLNLLVNEFAKKLSRYLDASTRSALFSTPLQIEIIRKQFDLCFKQAVITIIARWEMGVLEGGGDLRVWFASANARYSRLGWVPSKLFLQSGSAFTVFGLATFFLMLNFSTEEWGYRCPFSQIMHHQLANFCVVYRWKHIFDAQFLLTYGSLDLAIPNWVFVSRCFL